MLECRRHPLANYPAHRPAQLYERHPHRRDSAGVARRGRDGANHVHGRCVLQGHQRRPPFRVRFVRPVHGAVDASVHHLYAGSWRTEGAAIRHCGRASQHCVGGQHPGYHRSRLLALTEKMVTSAPPIVEVADLHVRYGRREALKGITLDVRRNEILGIIGPAQSGKTTLLKTINRTIDDVPGAVVTGTVKVEGKDVRQVEDVFALRRKIGMVAPLPVGLPLSIFDNVAFAPRMAGIRNRRELAERVERCLRQAALWDEVKDRLDSLGTKLSGGQQQRLTLARALSHDPEILCLDEFSIAIDPVTTMRIEDVLKELRARMTIILVTNLIQQARRLADRTAFLLNGELVELGRTEVIFSDNPASRKTYEYVNGIFG